MNRGSLIIIILFLPNNMRRPVVFSDELSCSMHLRSTKVYLSTFKWIQVH
nr:MAG TPA: hypothetical protein [Bacteriophage sp.]